MAKWKRKLKFPATAPLNPFAVIFHFIVTPFHSFRIKCWAKLNCSTGNGFIMRMSGYKLILIK